MKHLITIIIVVFSSLYVSAQKYYVRGAVTDAQTGETLIGANILYGEKLGVVSDFNGNYSVELPAGTYNFRISYVGYDKVELQVVISNQNQTLNFVLRSKILEEVTINADWARARETPVAFTNITPMQISNELAGKDLPMILNTTPGVYATQQGGGDGDARINIRGFPQNYVGVMIDGIPVNDMENGWVYWSNWFGLDAITRSMQVQRGLGVSKLAIPSVGGTINIITKGIETERQGSVKQYVDESGKLQTTLGYTSGLLKNGWGFTLGGSYKTGKTWVQETYTKGYFYYFKIDKRWNRHITSITGFGAPQEHDQRYYKSSIATYSLDYARKIGIDVDAVDENGNYIYRPAVNNKGVDYNYHWGYLKRDRYDANASREAQNEKINQFHKPQFSLRDSWNATDRIYVANTLYLSIGRGGGIGLRNSIKSDQLVQDPTRDDYGQIDFQSIYDYNSKIYNTPLGLHLPYNLEYSDSLCVSNNYLAKSNNNHIWYGYIGNVDFNYSESITFSGGVDVRSYKGTHYMTVYDLLGGDYAIDDEDKRTTDNMKRVGDKISYYDDGFVRYGGLFGQAEYKTDIISTFLNISYARSQIKRNNYFEKQETDWKGINNYTLKGGFNYNFTEHSNAFVNLGYMSKIRDFDAYFAGYHAIFLDDIDNARIKAIELGYNFHSPKFSANLNCYYTRWENKDIGSITIDEAEGNVPGMDARHTGIELDFVYKIFQNLEFQGLVSLGDWIWDSKVDNLVLYNKYSKFPEDTIAFDARGIHVGDAAQTQLGASIRYEPVKGLYMKLQTTYFARYYSDFSPEDCMDENKNPIEPWIIPSYYLVDLNLGYTFKPLKDKKYILNINGNITNLFNAEYISDAQDNNENIQKINGDRFQDHSANSAGVFFGAPRRFVVNIEFKF